MSSLEDTSFDFEIIGAGIAALCFALTAFERKPNIRIRMWPKYPGFSRPDKGAANGGRAKITSSLHSVNFPRSLSRYAFPIPEHATVCLDEHYVHPHCFSQRVKAPGTGVNAFQPFYYDLRDSLLRLLYMHYAPDHFHFVEPHAAPFIGLTREDMRKLAYSDSKAQIICADGRDGVSKSTFFGGSPVEIICTVHYPHRAVGSNAIQVLEAFLLQSGGFHFRRHAVQLNKNSTDIEYEIFNLSEETTDKLVKHLYATNQEELLIWRGGLELAHYNVPSAQPSFIASAALSIPRKQILRLNQLAYSRLTEGNLSVALRKPLFKNGLIRQLHNGRCHALGATINSVTLSSLLPQCDTLALCLTNPARNVSSYDAQLSDSKAMLKVSHLRHVTGALKKVKDWVSNTMHPKFQEEVRIWLSNESPGDHSKAQDDEMVQQLTKRVQHLNMLFADVTHQGKLFTEGEHTHLDQVGDFSGKCIIVTGGNRGIGRGISEACAKGRMPAGAKVAIIYHSAKDAKDVAAEIGKQYNTTVEAWQCDVGDQDLVKKTFHEIDEKLGPVTGVVANAGVSVVKPALEMNKKDFDKVYDTNVFGQFATACAGADLFIKRGYKDGSIVLTCSMSSQIVNKGITQVFYNSSKAAASSIVKQLAAEWAGKCRINALSPGYVATDQTSHMDPKLLEWQKKELVPLGRFAEPKEQANMALFLLSDFATYCHGQEYFVDGGAQIW